MKVCLKPGVGGIVVVVRILHHSLALSADHSSSEEGRGRSTSESGTGVGKSINI